MGYSFFWIAVKGKSPEVVRLELKLSATGDREEVPESPVTGVELPGGWYVVLDNKSLDFAAPTVLARLSQGAHVVTCFVEEHVMASEASQWAGGKRVWHIGHDSDQGLMHLDTVGQLPSCFEELRTSNIAHQKEDTEGDVDYLFEVPLEVAQTLCGFRHDVDPPRKGDARPYEVLARGGGSGS